MGPDREEFCETVPKLKSTLTSTHLGAFQEHEERFKISVDLERWEEEA